MDSGYFKGKVIIITGASSGIGLASARLFSSYGANLVLAARSIDKLHALAAELSSDPSEIICVKTDVSVEEDCRRLIDEAVRRGGKVGIVVDEENLAQSRELVGYYLKSALGSAMWGSEGGVRVANSHTEPTFGSAMSIIADRAKYNALLGIEN